MSKTLCQFFGITDSSSCGYCHSGEEEGEDEQMKEIKKENEEPKTKENEKELKSKKETTSGFFFNVPCDLYEKMLSRQWRRCGKYYYQPSNRSTCCPQYTIRLNVTKFQPSKRHKRLLNKVNNYLSPKKKILRKKKAKKKKVFPEFAKIDDIFKTIFKDLLDQNFIPQKFEELEITQLLNSCKCRISKKKKKEKSQNPDLVSTFPMIVSGRLKKKGIDLPSTRIAELFISEIKNTKEKTTDTIPIKQVENLKNGVIQIYLTDKYKKEIKNELSLFIENKKSKNTQKEIQKEMEVEEKEEKDEILINVERAKYKKDEFLLYKKYQVAIHQDKPEELSPKKYKRFLIETSLNVEKNNGAFDGNGTYHVRYVLKNSRKLIAVSVWDVLPQGVSSVYFFYDTDYKHLSLGVYSALKEIELIKQQHQAFPQLKYYYLGFYIHNCIKMKYKAQFKPSKLLCNVTWKWIEIEKCLPKLDKAKFAQFFEEPEKEKKEENQEEKTYDINRTLVLFQNSILFLGQLLSIGLELKDDVLKKINEFYKSLGSLTSGIAYYLDPETDFKDEGIMSILKASQNQ